MAIHMCNDCCGAQAEFTIIWTASNARAHGQNMAVLYTHKQHGKTKNEDIFLSDAPGTLEHFDMSMAHHGFHMPYEYTFSNPNWYS